MLGRGELWPAAAVLLRLAQGRKRQLERSFSMLLLWSRRFGTSSSFVSSHTHSPLSVTHTHTHARTHHTTHAHTRTHSRSPGKAKQREEAGVRVPAANAPPPPLCSPRAGLEAGRVVSSAARLSLLRGLPFSAPGTAPMKPLFATNPLLSPPPYAAVKHPLSWQLWLVSLPPSPSYYDKYSLWV